LKTPRGQIAKAPCCTFHSTINNSILVGQHLIQQLPNTAPPRLTETNRRHHSQLA